VAHTLGLYIFSDDQAEIEYGKQFAPRFERLLLTTTVLDNTLSGGVTINDALLHAGFPEVPCGGVGDWHGSLCGKYGFDTFKHRRVVVKMSDWLDRFMGFRYPPYKLTKSNPMTKFSTPLKTLRDA